MSNIAGLDIATTIGLCVKKGDAFIASAFKASVPRTPFHLGDPRDDHSVESVFGDPEKTLNAVREGKIGLSAMRHLRTWLIDNDVGYCAIEMPLPSNLTRTKTRIDLNADFAGQSVVKTEEPGTSFASIFRGNGLEFAAAMVCAELNIPSVFVAQQTWRLSFTGRARWGSRNAAKDAARAACRRHGIQVTNDDQADAAGVCWHLDSILNPYGARRANDLFAASG